MIFLRGEVPHRNLSAAYMDFPAPLSTLKTGDFSGIIEIEVPEVMGLGRGRTDGPGSRALIEFPRPPRNAI